MSIRFPPPITEKCIALINLGNLLQIFDINLFMRALQVTRKLNENELFVQDVQDLKLLCSIIIEYTEVNESLREDVKELSLVLDLFINTAASPTMACGMWSNVIF